MTFALARPQFEVSLPRVEGTVILVFDVSGSMSAGDIKPTRLEAAKAAALSFIQRQPPSVQVGIVAFSDGGLSVVAPTNEQDTLMAAVSRLTPERGTSVANGILTALDLIERSTGQGGSDAAGPATPAPVPAAPAAPPEHPSAVIALLTDGENNMSPPPLEAAARAAELGVRIDTIGVGSPEGVTLKVNGFVVHTRLDEAALRQISQVSGGTYFNARTETDLRNIYEGIRPALVIKPDHMEVTSLFAGLGMLMLLIGGAFSLWWFGRVP
jgi:Ca-activated chloride channel family protein